MQKVKKKNYLVPEVQVCAFAPEKGFALSVQCETLNMGFPEGEKMDEMYNDANGTTEGLEGGISF